MGSAPVFDLRRFCLHDGPGIRTTLFLQGCPLRCFWCHNPESQGQELEQKNLVNPSSPFRTGVYTVGRILPLLLRDLPFYRQSGGGVTFSGGEPLLHVPFLKALLSPLQEAGVPVALDTCGQVAPELWRDLLPLVSLWLWDIKSLDEARYREGTGGDLLLMRHSWEQVLDGPGRIWLRVPLIGGFNDSEADLERLLAWAAQAGKGRVERISLLSLHLTARDKYQRLGRSFVLEERQIPSRERLAHWQGVLEQAGYEVGLGS